MAWFDIHLVKIILASLLVIIFSGMRIQVGSSVGDCVTCPKESGQ